MKPVLYKLALAGFGWQLSEMGCCSVSPEMTRKSLSTPIDGEIVAIGVATIYAPVAQLERVADYESVGWGFESLRACQNFKEIRE